MNNTAASYALGIGKVRKRSYRMQKMRQGVEEKYREWCARALGKTPRADSPDTGKKYDVNLHLMDL